MNGDESGGGSAPEPQDPVYRRLFERARPHLQTRQNDLHTRVSYGFALRLLAGEEGDPAVVIPAVLLHDLGWSRVPEDRQLLAFGPAVKEPELTRVHEREGARMAAEILAELGYPEDAARQVVEIVAGHDTRLAALSASDALVKDADKLFRFSGQGFPIDCGRFGRDPGPYLEWLAARIPEWFFTETGKRLAREEVDGRREELGPAAGEGAA